MIDELVHSDAIGCFVLSEYNHGSNAISVETEATYDPASHEFVLNTPNLPWLKWMPNTAQRQAKKKAIMFCRLLMDGEDHGVLPFLVPLNSDGVEVRLMGEEPGLMLDNAVTRLRNVRIPHDFLLLDEHTNFGADGRFSATEPSRRKRLLNAIEALSVARASAGRAATAGSQIGLLLAVNLASQRCVFAPKSEDIPLSEYSNFYRPILSAIGRVYASQCYYNTCVDEFDRDLGATRTEQLGRNASLLKAMATEDAIDILSLCRKRTGSHGMFACNRIVEQLIAAHGLFSAEGESDILLLKLGRELLMKVNYESPGSSSWTLSLGKTGPQDWLKLLRTRESKLVRTLRFDAFVKQRTTPLATVWKRSTDAVIDVARVHARRVMAEAFYEAVQRARPNTDARAALEGLFEVHCLDLIHADVGWYVSHGVVSSWRARRLASRHARAMDEMAPRLLDLVRAFEIDNDILRAPMGEDDVEQVFTYLTDDGPLPPGTVMQQYNTRKRSVIAR